MACCPTQEKKYGVMCSNENCRMEIRQVDKEQHENEICEFRKMGRLIELDEKVETMNNEMKKNHVDMKKIVGKLEGSLVGMNKMVNEKVETLKGMNKMINEKVEAVRNRQEKVRPKVKKEVGEVKKKVKDVKENLFKVNKDVDEVKVMMSQVLEKLNMLEHLNKLPSPTKGYTKRRYFDCWWQG